MSDHMKKHIKFMRETCNAREYCYMLKFDYAVLSIDLSLSSTVKAIIDHEVKNGIPSNRILLGGFSQVSDPSCTII